jgi:hypothetical protein
MAEAPHSPDPEGEAPMPVWVYAVGAVVILVTVAFVGLHLAGGGIPVHGPPQ